MAMITIYIDNEPYQIENNDNLLAGVLSQQLDLSYFCWHPAMGSVGACRQCAVTQYQDENDTRGKLVMSCMTPVNDGMRIGLKDAGSKIFREQVISAMMTNHPHDCPVCAEGGECHLQDMTVMTGHSVRHYQGQKRTFTNQNLGPLVGHEMNRCISCYRCVRFYQDYAGGTDFGVFGSKNQLYFGRQTDGTLTSEFSGNLVEVCPTGVFTNKLFSAHFTRKWDLQSAPSVCAHCSVGCNTSIGARYGSVRRVINRFNQNINGYFLCDRGRYGIGFVNGEQRIHQPKGISHQPKAVPDPTGKVNTQPLPGTISKLDVAKALAHFRHDHFIGIGSARASLESNTLLKHLVGARNFSLGLTDNEMLMARQHQHLLSCYKAPSLLQMEQSDAVLIIGEDITQTAPRMALSIRQAARNAGLVKAATIGILPWQDEAVRTYAGDTLSPVFSLQCAQTKLDDICQQRLLLAPDDIERCINALAGIYEQAASSGQSVAETMLDDDPLLVNDNERVFVKQLVAAFASAKQPLIVTGWSLQSSRLLAAVNRLMSALSAWQQPVNQPENITDAERLSAPMAMQLTVVVPQANSVGALSLIDQHTLSVEQLLMVLAANEADSVIAMEQEAAAFHAVQLRALREHCKTLMVLEHSESALTAIADIVLPVSAISEADGHLVNYQGLLQRFYQVVPPVLPVQDSWRWLLLIADTLFADLKLHCDSLGALHQYFAEQNVRWAQALVASACSTSTQAAQIQSSHRPVAQQTHRASGRTAQMANISVHEAKATQSKDSPLIFSMEGQAPQMSDDMPFSWAPGWNSNQSINQYNARHKTIAERLIEFEQTGNGLPETSSVQKPLNDKLIFIQRLPSILLDWQARMTPEFMIMYGGNVVCMSTVTARHYQLEQVSFVMMMRSADAAEHGLPEVCARRQIDDALPFNLVAGSVFEFTVQQSDVPVLLTAANEQQIAKHQQREAQRIAQAQQQKAVILKRLLASDQHIPIRLVSGGLDDV